MKPVCVYVYIMYLTIYCRFSFLFVLPALFLLSYHPSIHSSIHFLYMKILSFFLLSGRDNIFNILITSFFFHKNTSTD